MCAVTLEGTVWCWGWNAFGQLGNGTTNDSWVPVQAGLTASPPLTNVLKLGGRPYFTLAEKADGTIWAWGDFMNGLQVFPNLVGLIGLSGVAAAMLRGPDSKGPARAGG